MRRFVAAISVAAAVISGVSSQAAAQARPARSGTTVVIPAPGPRPPIRMTPVGPQLPAPAPQNASQPASAPPSGPVPGMAIGQFPPTPWISLDDQRWQRIAEGSNGRIRTAIYQFICYGAQDGTFPWAGQYLIRAWYPSSSLRIEVNRMSSTDSQLGAEIAFSSDNSTVRASPGFRCAMRLESGLLYLDSPSG